MITNHKNVKTVMDEEAGSGEYVETVDLIRMKILHILTIYPKISMPMIQVGVGTSLMPALWKPILNQLIVEDLVRMDEFTAVTPSNRVITYKRYFLTPQ